jgi:hypothetical protein
MDEAVMHVASIEPGLLCRIATDATDIKESQTFNPRNFQFQGNLHNFLVCKS